MKYIKNKFMLGSLALFGILTIASCKKGIFYPGINTNPSELQTPQPANLLPGIIEFTGYEWGGDASRFPSLFMQYVTGAANQSLSYGAYAVGSGEVDAMWTTGLYGGGIMNNAYQLINISAANKQLHYEAVGKILMANALGLTTDFWGDVPYSQAFQGVKNLDPKYDPQQTIYADLDGLLNDAITEINTTEVSVQPGADDIMYGGDMTKWLAFAYSLKAKFYLHLVKVDNSYYGKALAALTAGGFTSNDQSALVPFSGASSSSENPWSQFNSQRGDIAFTGYIYDIMTAAKDPRLAVYSDGAGGLGTLYGSANSSVPLMTYDETLFIKAEAAFQTGDKATAATAYNGAVAANLIRTISDPTYASVVAKTASTITLADIMTQKYIAQFLNPETWTDWRRTGLPPLTPNPTGALNGQIPRSLLYPSSEVKLNINTPPSTSLLRRVWWDK